ncbi:branched-chain amino acid aminotransferase [Clostridium cavendishii DSM 21758]|uniref:Branched-chain amino acid aminotransferase n=1 Tax=Clostridium cavendishii DSM 21758 TaxID=1121302 RepID=A0A1M6B5Z5_9CLOT|nr:aminotransferase class IV [Clostridium cavendishii]SHI44162.1 branched-chain amino acid aminotransferase [Clostridium cavendishii DSM 21758]
MECMLNYFIENGQIKENDKFNEGLLSSKGIVYEVFRVTEGIPMFLEKHVARMSNSLKLINKEMPYSYEEIKNQVDLLIKKNDVKVGNIKFLYNSLIDEKNLIAYFIKHSYPTEEMYKEGIDTIFYFAERENPNAKIINKSFRDSVNEEIKKKNAYEAILVNHDGNITEGSRSNMFMVKGGAVYTSNVKAVLPGVTRSTIIELCKKNNIKVCEVDINYKEIETFDGLFMSGTSPKVLPIRRVENINFNSSENDTIVTIMNLFNENIKKYIEKNK